MTTYEISSNDLLTTKTYNVENLVYNLILENAYNNNLVTDISKTNYNKYFNHNNKHLRPVNNLFCDNVILTILQPPNYIEQKNNHISLVLDRVRAINGTVRRIFSGHNIIIPAFGGVKTLYVTKYENNTENKHTLTQIDSLLANNPEILTKFETQYQTTEFYIVTVKVELCDIDFRELLPKYQNLEPELSREGFFLKELDITQDFANTLDRDRLIEHLTSNFDFSLQNSSIQNFSGKQKTILQNQKQVGNNCLTYLDTILDTTIRCKLYNKLVFQIESSGVRSTLGSNLNYLVSSTQKPLREALFATESTGITRLEITIYANALHNLEYYQKLIDDMLAYVDYPIFYETPLEKQFLALQEQISNSLVVSDPKNRTIYTALYCNLLTKRITGTKKKYNYPQAEFERITNLILANSTFSGIITHLILDSDNDKTKITQNTYVKHSGKAILPVSNNPMSVKTYPERNLLKILPEFFVPAKKIDKTSKPLFDITKVENIRPVSTNSTKTRERMLAEQVILEEREKAKLQLQEILEKEREQLEETRKQYEKAKEITKLLDSYVEEFRRASVSLSNVKVGDILAISAVRPISTRYGKAYTLLTQDNNLYFADYNNIQFLDRNIDKLLEYTHENITFYLPSPIDTPNIEPIYHLLSSSTYTNKYSRKTHRWRMSSKLNLCTPEDQQKQAEQQENTREMVKNTLRVEEELKVKVKDCLRLEVLEQGTIYTIDSIFKTTYRGRNRYIFTLESRKDHFVSNFWLRECLDRVDLDNAVEFLRFKTLRTQTTPQNKVELVTVMLC